MTKRKPSPMFIRLTVKTLEDLQVGAGTGSGDIDALVQRDRRCCPVIRASHFKGLLREAGEELIHLAQITQDKLDRLLGTDSRRPQQGPLQKAALRLTSLYVPPENEAATLVWGSSKRVDGGRAPEEDTLHFVEHIAAGTCFQATLRLTDPTFQPLLDRLLKRIDRIGGGRNRGGGLVKLDWKPREAPFHQGQQKDVTGTRLRLVLRNIEPLSLPTTGHPGNLIRSHSFIRGQTLRGALMAWAIHSGQSDKLKLFHRVSIGDALPLPEDIVQADTVLPMPLSILTEKPRGGDVSLPWWASSSSAAPAFDSLCSEGKTDEKPKRPGAHEYLCRLSNNGAWLRYTPTMKVRLRNATPRKGSVEDAKLFSMEEIAEDTCFQADLHFSGNDGSEVAAFIGMFAPLFCGGDWLAIGRGGAPVIVESIAVIPEGSPKKFTDQWTLTLASDLIARGEHLGFLDNLCIDRLCALAGITTESDWKIEKSVVETEPIYGFNAVSGLQRVPVLALRRGSCWRITGANSAKLARKLAETSLGERTNEGLGRFLIDMQPIGELGRPQCGKAQPIANRNEEILSLARQLSNAIKKIGPSLSQLQWLRGQALAATDLQQLDCLLSEVENAPQRRPQGGKSWSAFPIEELKDVFAKLQHEDKKRELHEKRQLLSHFVQWRVPLEKEKRG